MQVATKKALFHLPKRAWSAVLLPISWVILTLTSANISIAENFFALGFYKFISQLISKITGFLPFSLLEFGIIALIILLFVFIYIFIRKVVKNKGNRSAIVKHYALNLLCIFSIGFFIFTLLCGVNYNRRPFSYYSGLTIQKSSVNELNSLCTELAAEANLLRSQIKAVDANGVTIAFENGYNELSQTARQAMQGLGKKYPVLDGYYPPVKPVFFSGFMSRTQLTGIYSPFTMEANVNTACTEYTIPATMCHELSHLRGFMREDEANFIAYLACEQSQDIRFRYSGTMLALVYAGNRLYEASPKLYEALQASYSRGVATDMTADYYYWKQFDDTVISNTSDAVNDAYLKANNQQDGTESYGRIVDLLLAKRRLMLN
ncbi:MAG: DUF3810 domain-containing protein [Hydrogenoanaerobacterium sp.]